jgi:type IV pilus assembly protein PilN
MRISINLATRPFVELRPLFARLRIAMVALAVLAIGLGIFLHQLNVRAEAATGQMDLLKARTVSLQRERASNEARMKQPQNQSVLERSQFLNTLFAEKSFSWTAVMMDLEKVVPGGIQVTSIEPVISKEGDISIRLRVTGDRDKAIQLVRNLETSQRFVKPRIGGETGLTAEKASALGRGQAPGFQAISAATGQPVGGNLVEFEIFSGYNPLPPPAPKDGAGKREEGRGKSLPRPKPAPKAAPAKVPPSARPVAKPVVKPAPGSVK